jgi:hypothetical protein
MQVELVNDGPVTICMDTKNKEWPPCPPRGVHVCNKTNKIKDEKVSKEYW